MLTKRGLKYCSEDSGLLESCTYIGSQNSPHIVLLLWPKIDRVACGGFLQQRPPDDDAWLLLDAGQSLILHFPPRARQITRLASEALGVG